jgi:ubiquinone/menaquinone biosynthesis C-methylase UbiE
MSEANRILREYERRERVLPPELYAATKPVNLFLRHGRERALLAMLSRQNLLPLGERRILDVGCGSGQWLVDFETWGAKRANLAGIDLIPARVRVAQLRLTASRDKDGKVLSAGADIRVGDASRLPWDDRSFDIVCQSMVFSSILDSGMRQTVAREMARVLSAGGAVVWYDFFTNNPRNPNVRGIRRAEVSRLFPEFRMDSRRVTLMPPLARWLVPRSRLVADILAEMRLSNTHFMMVLRREQASTPGQNEITREVGAGG